LYIAIIWSYIAIICVEIADVGIKQITRILCIQKVGITHQILRVSIVISVKRVASDIRRWCHVFGIQGIRTKVGSKGWRHKIAFTRNKKNSHPQ